MLVSWPDFDADKRPIIDRLGRTLLKFSGDDTVDVSEWLDNLERRCKLEQGQHMEVVDFMLQGKAARIFRSFTISEASQWEVVKGTFVSQYGMIKQMSYRCFSDRQLRLDEPVEVYVDNLQR